MAFGSVKPNITVLTISASTSATRVSATEDAVQSGQAIYQAPLNNSGTLWVGDSTASVATQIGLPLRPGDVVGFDGDYFYGTIHNNLDLSSVYVVGNTPTDRCIVVNFKARQ